MQKFEVLFVSRMLVACNRLFLKEKRQPLTNNLRFIVNCFSMPIISQNLISSID